jgi:hypothetical protein
MTNKELLESLIETYKELCEKQKNCSYIESFCQVALAKAEIAEQIIRLKIMIENAEIEI